AQRLLRRFRERVAPHVTAVQDKLPEPVARASRNRSVQAGAAVAAVGVVGLVVGTAAGPSAPEVDKAAVAAPMQQAPQQSAPQQQEVLQQHATLQQQPPPQQAEAKAAEPAPEPEAPLGPPVEGIDVSNHNGSIDWT